MAIVRLPTFSLQTRIILLVILIVSTVLSLSVYLSVQIAEKALEEDVRERGVIVAQGLVAGILSEQDLEDLRALGREVQAVMRSRGGINRIVIFALRPEGLVSIVSSDRAAISTLREVVQRSIKRGRTVTALRVSAGERVWDVGAPIRIGRRVVGAVGVEVSLKGTDRLAARQRWQSLGIMGIAALVIVGFLGWYLQRNVNRPIQVLVETMARAERGDLEARADVKTPDELGRLAESFNRMLQRIKEGYQQNLQLLVRINNFNQELKLQVEQATRELAERNEELRKVNERLFDIQRELARSDRLAAVGQLAAMVAHEVGTPLHSISGHVQVLLQERAGDEEAIQRLRIIESQIARMVEILQGFLTASNPVERPFESVDVNALIRNLLDFTGPAIDQKGVKVSFDPDPSLPQVLGDAGQLQQVLLNLILNALDAMPGGGRLTITTRGPRRSTSNGSRAGSDGQGPDEAGSFETPQDAGLLIVDEGFVEITVSDTGEGIPPENLDRIFEPFFTTKGVGRGTGLGLAICRRIVKAHGGRIMVASQVGEGTCFTILLPANKG